MVCLTHSFFRSPESEFLFWQRAHVPFQKPMLKLPKCVLAIFFHGTQSQTSKKHSSEAKKAFLTFSDNKTQYFRKFFLFFLWMCNLHGEIPFQTAIRLQKSLWKSFEHIMKYLLLFSCGRISRSCIPSKIKSAKMPLTPQGRQARN
jgi:hypothetical protein